jgi:4-alpha-glucanotransferase
MSTSARSRRIVGITVPLFSLRTASCWGIGEIPDLARFGAWARDVGARLVQLLPLGEISGSETSPYGALTAFGIDPMYIAWEGHPDLPADELAAALGDDGVRTLHWLRAQDRVDYQGVRWLKEKALRAAWANFARREAATNSPRAQALHAFIAQHATWLVPYATFRALKDAHEQRAWWEWEASLRDSLDAAKERARTMEGSTLNLHLYAQWVAHTQWDEARAALRGMDVEVMGDLPFMVGSDSADVWSCRGEFRDDTLVGAPGDQFDPDGQEWGLPPYRWDAMRRNGFQWLRARAGYAASRYDRFRIDHLVGFYRTYQRPKENLRGPDGRLRPGFFDPSDEPAQKAHGEAVLSAMIAASRAHGADLIAEDLGVIPDFVRPSLASMDVPGYKVLIWEQRDGVFRDPGGFPARSVACFSTHDTAPVSVWWNALPAWERAAVCRLPGMSPALPERFNPEVHTALLDTILRAGSDLVLLLAQEVLGDHTRINTPSTVGAHNWTWRLPRDVSALLDDPDAAASVNRVREAIARAGR